MNSWRLQNSTGRVLFKAHLTGTDTPATGKTIAVTLSKNGGAFGNPNAGASNATEIANGWYYFAPAAQDRDTLGPLVWRGTEGTIDPAEAEELVVDAVRLGMTALPNAAPDTAGGLPISDAGGLDLDAMAAILQRSEACPPGTLAAIAAGATTLPPGLGIDPNAVLIIVLTGGTNANRRARLHTYSGAGDVWTPSPAWNDGGQPVPSGAVTFAAFAIPNTSPADLAAIADAVHDEPMAGHVTAGSFGANVASLLGYVDELETRLTAARAGYLDKLNIAGNVASSGEVTAIQNNTRVNRSLPAVLERPDAGSTVFRIELACYDDAGNMETPDAAPTLDVVNQAGVSRNANLDATTMTLVSTGRYRSTYTVDAAHALEQLLFAFSVTEGGETRVYLNTILVVDTTAVDFTAADRTQLQAIHGKLPTRPYLAAADAADGTPADSAGTGTLVGRLTAPRAAALDNLDAAVSSRAAPGAAMTLEAGERSSIVAALFAAASEGAETFIETFRIMRAGIVGKSSGHSAGTPAYRDRADAKDRITALTTVDGDRTAVTTDGT